MIKANKEMAEPAGEETTVVARRPHDPPAAIANLGWRYHHLGIPHGEPRSDERHVEALGIHIAGFETSPYGVEWMRFDPEAQVPEIIRTVPHLAFEVDNLEVALSGREVLIAPNSPSPGVRVAFIVHDGAPVELIEFNTAGASHAEKNAES
jgi:hypothetical protein